MTTTHPGAWDKHLWRNRSGIVELFWLQMKSLKRRADARGTRRQHRSRLSDMGPFQCLSLSGWRLGCPGVWLRPLSGTPFVWFPPGAGGLWTHFPHVQWTIMTKCFRKCITFTVFAKSTPLSYSWYWELSFLHLSPQHTDPAQTLSPVLNYPPKQALSYNTNSLWICI